MSSASLSAKLFSEELAGTRRSIFAELSEAGLKLDAVDSGARPEAYFGRDYEFGIEVAAADLPRLAYHLILQHYAGRFGAVDELRTFAEEAGIKTKFSNW